MELNTMPGWAGSSQYFNRYMDPWNDDAIFSPEAINYWQDVDLYIGGSEHATGHLLYSRFWQKFMFDMGYVPKDEFAQKLINQGMITGESAFFNIIEGRLKKGDQDVSAFCQIIISKEVYDGLSIKEGLIDKLPKPLFDFLNERIDSYIELNRSYTDFTKSYLAFKSTNIDVDLVNKEQVSILQLKDNERLKVIGNAHYFDGKEVIPNERMTEDTRAQVFREVEKMSKSKYNVVNPDAICEEYGADSLRLYEMFLGPLEQSKPWNTAGITGVHSFLKKLWKLYTNGSLSGVEAEPTAENLKTLHKTIKKVEEDIENFSFNTSVSTFMICVNELTSQKCSSKAILEPLAILVSPYAPHIAEELWERLGNIGSIAEAPFPKFEEKFLVESSKEYPISFNGKMRFKMELPLDMSKDDIEAAVLAHEKTKEQLQGRDPKR